MLFSVELAVYRWLSERFYSERGQTLAEYGSLCPYYRSPS